MWAQFESTLFYRHTITFSYRINMIHIGTLKNTFGCFISLMNGKTKLHLYQNIFVIILTNGLTVFTNAHLLFTNSDFGDVLKDFESFLREKYSCTSNMKSKHIGNQSFLTAFKNNKSIFTSLRKNANFWKEKYTKS